MISSSTGPDPTGGWRSAGHQDCSDDAEAQAGRPDQATVSGGRQVGPDGSGQQGQAGVPHRRGHDHPDHEGHEATVGPNAVG